MRKRSVPHSDHECDCPNFSSSCPDQQHVGRVGLAAKPTGQLQCHRLPARLPRGLLLVHDHALKPAPGSTRPPRGRHWSIPYLPHRILLNRRKCNRTKKNRKRTHVNRRDREQVVNSFNNFNWGLINIFQKGANKDLSILTIASCTSDLFEKTTTKTHKSIIGKLLNKWYILQIQTGNRWKQISI